MARCTKGKACGNTCIAKGAKCRVSLGAVVAPQVKKAVASVHKFKDLKNPHPDVIKSVEKADMAGVKGQTTRTPGLVKSQEVNWRAALQEGSEYIGAGAYGNFFKVPGANLHKDLPDGVYGLKSGRIGKNEVEVIKLVGERDLGPKLVAARTHPGSFSKLDGQIAMSVVPGVTFIKAPEISGGVPKNDSYWKAMADLHRAGVMHGDPHQANILVDSKGKGRFVDFGASSVGSTGALREAMEYFGFRSGVRSNDNFDSGSTKYGKAWDRGNSNISKLEEEVKKLGWSQNNWRELIDSGYVKPGTTEDQAKHLINTLYEGI